MTTGDHTFKEMSEGTFLETLPKLIELGISTEDAHELASIARRLKFTAENMELSLPSIQDFILMAKKHVNAIMVPYPHLSFCLKLCLNESGPRRATIYIIKAGDGADDALKKGVAVYTG